MNASLAVLRAEARLFRREPASMFWIAAFPTLLMVILGLIPSFREHGADLGGRRVIDLYVPVVVLLAMMMAGIQAMPPVLTGYREQGILRRLATTPVRPISLLAAQIAVHAAVALGSAVLAIVVGRVAFGVDLPRQAPGYLFTLLLTTLTALAIGGAITAVARTGKVANALGTAVFIPMMFTAGVWVPVQAMPDVLRRVLEFTPFGAASQALDQAMTGSWPAWSHLGVIALWTAVLVAAAARWFRWE